MNKFHRLDTLVSANEYLLDQIRDLLLKVQEIWDLKRIDDNELEKTLMSSRSYLAGAYRTLLHTSRR